MLSVNITVNPQGDEIKADLRHGVDIIIVDRMPQGHEIKVDLRHGIEQAHRVDLPGGGPETGP